VPTQKQKREVKFYQILPLIFSQLIYIFCNNTIPDYIYIDNQ